MKPRWGNWRSWPLCTAVILPQLPTQEGPVRVDKEPCCSVCSGREARTPCGVPPPPPPIQGPDVPHRWCSPQPHPTPSPGEPCSHSVPSADVPWDGGQIQEHPDPQDGWLALVAELSRLCQARHRVLVSQLLQQPFLPRTKTPAVERRDWQVFLSADYVPGSRAGVCPRGARSLVRASVLNTTELYT